MRFPLDSARKFMNLERLPDDNGWTGSATKISGVMVKFVYPDGHTTPDVSIEIKKHNQP
jgi:hypothetical protein